MKKFLLSAFVVIMFVVYAISMRSKNDSLAITPVASSQTNPANTSQPTTNNTPSTYNPPPTSLSTSSTKYNDGQYTGSVADAYYGNVQVKVVVSGGKITDVQFMSYPHDRQTSQMINMQAMPMLKSEVIQAQSANIDGVTGASATSGAFRQSLSSALTQAKI